MKEKKPIYKKWWFWVIVVFLLIGFIGGRSGSNPEEVTDSVAESSNTDVSPQESSVATAEVSEEATLESIIGSDHENWQEIETSDGGYKISYKDTASYWDENSFVTEAIHNYVNLCSKVYADNLSCAYVELYIFVDMQDAKGNVSQSKGFMCSMTQEEFNTFNWDNLKGTKIYDVFSSSCTEFYIAPGILSNVSTDKVIYYN